MSRTPARFALNPNRPCNLVMIDADTFDAGGELSYAKERFREFTHC